MGHKQLKKQGLHPLLLPLKLELEPSRQRKIDHGKPIFTKAIYVMSSLLNYAVYKHHYLFRISEMFCVLYMLPNSCFHTIMLGSAMHYVLQAFHSIISLSYHIIS